MDWCSVKAQGQLHLYLLNHRLLDVGTFKSPTLTSIESLTPWLPLSDKQ
jgi:hypothetical protein